MLSQIDIMYGFPFHSCPRVFVVCPLVRCVALLELVRCDDGCESDDGDIGRVCDTTCKDGDPYGKLGCSALDGLYGNYCRVCYNDMDLARENDTEDDRAIM